MGTPVIDRNDGLHVRGRSKLRVVTAIANKAARGLSGARNSGLPEAVPGVVAFLGDDAIANQERLAPLPDG